MGRVCRWGVVPLVVLCASLSWLPRGAAQESKADRLWRVELDRMQIRMADGDYEGALVVAKKFEEEFDDKKRRLNTPELRASADVIRQAGVWSHIARGVCEKNCGHYRIARGRLELAESKLSENRRLYGQQFAIVLGQYQASQAAQAWAVVIDDQLAWRIERWRQQRLRPMLDAMSNAVYETELSQMLVYDGLATLCVDESMPLRMESAKLLSKAEGYFDLAQEIRERNFQGLTSSFTIHGDQQATFFRNYGRLFLKRAELKLERPETPEDDRLVDLLERSDDYLARAFKEFSSWQFMIDEMRQLAHEGSIAVANKAMKKKLQEKQMGDAEIEAFLRDVKTICVGYADLCFNVAELRIVQAKVAADDKDTSQVTAHLDEAEQMLLNGADMLAVVTPQADHPYLVMCYAETAAVAAMRAILLNEELRDDLAQYLDMGKEIMQKRHLDSETVQGRYLARAEDLCRRARAKAGQ